MVKKLKTIGEILLMIPMLIIWGIFALVAIGSLLTIVVMLIAIVNIIPIGIMVAYHFTDGEVAKTILLFTAMALTSICTAFATWYMMKEEEVSITYIDPADLTQMENNVNTNK